MRMAIVSISEAERNRKTLLLAAATTKTIKYK